MYYKATNKNIINNPKMFCPRVRGKQIHKCFKQRGRSILIVNNPENSNLRLYKLRAASGNHTANVPIAPLLALL